MLAKLSVVIFLVALGIYLYSRNKSTPSAQPTSDVETNSELDVEIKVAPSTEETAPPETETPPKIHIELDWANETLKSAVSEWQSAQDPEQQLLYLNQAITECYKQRKSRQYCIYGQSVHHSFLALIQSQVDSFSDKQAKHAGVSFMQLASLSQESGHYEQAISLCEQALTYKLTDGTITGFEGRITRIKRAQEKSNAE